MNELKYLALYLVILAITTAGCLSLCVNGHIIACNTLAVVGFILDVSILVALLFGTKKSR